MTTFFKIKTWVHTDDVSIAFSAELLIINHYIEMAANWSEKTFQWIKLDKIIQGGTTKFH